MSNHQKGVKKKDSCCPFLCDLLLTRSVVSVTTVCVSSEHAAGLEDVKHIVHLLHTAIHQPEHHLLKERQLMEKLDNLKQQLSPLEKVGRWVGGWARSKSRAHVRDNPSYSPSPVSVQVKAQLSRTAEFHSSRALWVGLALLSVQGGALAWLTWWVYSWDVMEPVTYFITYATSMGAFAYYVLTKQVKGLQRKKKHRVMRCRSLGLKRSQCILPHVENLGLSEGIAYTVFFPPHV